MSTHERVRKIAESPLSKSAVLFHLRNGRSSPSHNLVHNYQVAMTALESAVQFGERDPAKLQDLFLAGLFHDIIRSSQRVSDPKGIQKSSEASARFCQSQGLPTERARRIQRIITHPLGTPLGHHLEFADALFFLQESRLQTFAIENNTLRRMTSEEVGKIYGIAFRKKIGKLPPAMRKRLNRFASAVAGRNTTAWEIATEAFSHHRSNPTDPVFPQFAIAQTERLHEFVDLLSTMAIENARENPVFTRSIMRYLQNGQFKKYGGMDALTRQKIANLKTIIAPKPEVRVLPMNPRKRWIREVQPRLRRAQR